MLKLLLCIVVISAAQAAEPYCDVSDWGEWRSATHDNTVKSFPVPEQPDVDKGRLAFARLMALKLKTWEDMIACIKDGTCSEQGERANSQGIVPCVDGFSGDIPCDKVDMMSYVNITTLGYDTALEANDIWGWTDPATFKEYAIICLMSGTSFVDITDPVWPEVIGFLPTSTVSDFWRDAKVIGHWVYIVSEADDHGIQVFDLTRLRSERGFFEADHWYTGIGRCHNIVAHEETNLVYAVGCRQGTTYENCNEGLHIVDVSDPLNPEFVACFSEDGYVHDAQCVIYDGPDTDYQGNEICFCYNEDTFTIVDVTDKAAMTMISRTGYESADYTHQGWLTNNMEVVVMDDEGDEADSGDPVQKSYVWDVKDLDMPVLMNVYRAAFTSADHNQYIVGDLTYQANYMSGLRILSIDEELYELKEVAYFDTTQLADDTVFLGLWSVYPFFNSGNVIVSHTLEGLYTVRPDMEAIQAAMNKKTDLTQRHRYRQILSTNNNNVCPHLTEKELF